MRMGLLFVAILAAACLASCGGVTLSDSCRQRINDCLRTCPASQIDRNSDRGFNQPADTRSDCERRCQGMCYP
jgi:hypothetical protein